MISNAPQHAYVAETSGHFADRAGFVAWVLGRVQHAVCALHGHDAILQYERNRIFLRCTSCGHETPGWEVAHNTTLRHHVPEPRATLPARGDLAVARKIA